MIMKSKIYIITMLLISSSIFYGCEKFLDAKPRSALSHPNSLNDLRAILDHQSFINDVYPAVAQIGADEFMISVNGFAGLPVWYKDTYVWDDQGLDIGSWVKPYQAVSIANVVLEALERIKDGHTTVRNQLKGEALFVRGWMLFTLAQVYCAPYSAKSPNDGLGLVLRLDSDSDIKIGRSGLQDTYRQIFSDLEKALELLPFESEYITRPSKAACLAALSRVHLVIENFDQAEKMVDELFKLRNGLLDYNQLDKDLAYPLSIDANKELIYYGICGSTGHFMGNANTYIAPEVYGLYDEHDLRKHVYYTNGAEGMKFKGFYNGRLSDYFAGLAMDEMYLIKAECLARREVVDEGLSYLNILREHRYDNEYFEELFVDDAETLLYAVLEERRRQLVCRGLRWFDLRRLNRDSRFAVVLERRIKDNVSESVYTLVPNDLRYTALIPRDAIEVGNYQQNPR